MDIKLINIRELKDDINMFLYNIKGISLKELQLSNLLCELFGGATNEAICYINTNY